MLNYRVYRLDGAGKISSAIWVEAASDEEVRAKALERVPDGTCEIWERNRLVARIDKGAR